MDEFNSACCNETFPKAWTEEKALEEKIDYLEICH